MGDIGMLTGLHRAPLCQLSRQRSNGSGMSTKKFDGAGVAGAHIHDLGIPFEGSTKHQFRWPRTGQGDVDGGVVAGHHRGAQTLLADACVRRFCAQSHRRHEPAGRAALRRHAPAVVRHQDRLCTDRYVHEVACYFTRWRPLSPVDVKNIQHATLYSMV